MSTRDAMNITTIVFDFGNVLGFFSHRRAAEQLAAYTDMSAEDILRILFANDLEDDYESGRLSTAELRAILRDRFRLVCTDEEFDLAVGNMFTPNGEVCSLVPVLKPRYRLVLLSNTNDIHARYFRRQFADTLDLFDSLVLSYEVGLRKPHPDIYAHCHRLACCPPAQCLFIDDLAANVEAARACGWQGIVYHPGLDLRRELERHGVRTTTSFEKGE
jgi:FMN phosphatase YigB (HAD superfamily)